MSGRVLIEMLENLGDNSGIEDEGEDPHLPAALAEERIDLVDPPDQLCPGSSGASSFGNGLGLRIEPGSGLLCPLRKGLPPCSGDAGVRPEIAHEVPPWLGNVHEESCQEVEGVEGRGGRESARGLRLVQDAALLDPLLPRLPKASRVQGSFPKGAQRLEEPELFVGTDSEPE